MRTIAIFISLTTLSHTTPPAFAIATTGTAAGSPLFLLLPCGVVRGQHSNPWGGQQTTPKLLGGCLACRPLIGWPAGHTLARGHIWCGSRPPLGQGVSPSLSVALPLPYPHKINPSSSTTKYQWCILRINRRQWRIQNKRI
ncbi:hypothetical protein FH972_012987 [Carpinus fangiana]|uniref:Secreted protein n=1 Tax=Carpinus fangiana TaxID=176857 RepID=A0A5N6R5N1_9ROSI|nr:hypothetical protein FH972_012987 [Carpinus fangiana]